MEWGTLAEDRLRQAWEGEEDARWQPAGLRHPSSVRISKLLAVDKQIIKRVLGSLAPEDVMRVDASLRQAFALN